MKLAHYQVRYTKMFRQDSDRSYCNTTKCAGPDMVQTYKLGIYLLYVQSHWAIQCQSTSAV